MRAALGDAYTDALRRAYPDVPDSADFVMHWWDRAATAVRHGQAERFGLITTNSLGQTFNRRVVERNLARVEAAGSPLALAFAVPDHPWVDSSDGADVRVSMTVGASSDDFDAAAGRLAIVTDERDADGDGVAEVDVEDFVGRINANLSVGADVTKAGALMSNADVSNPGVKLHGAGFIVTPETAERLGLGRVPDVDRVIRPYRNGRDLTATPRGAFVIDLFGLTADEARKRFPDIYEHVLTTVKPERDANRRAIYRDNWWLFGEPRREMRRQTAGLPRYIVTPETAKHRLFQFLDASVLPDNKLVVIATDDAFHFGVLSSAVHMTWALAAGSLLEDRPVYVKTRCFETFPFPAATEAQAGEIRTLGEAIDEHRKDRQTLHPALGLTDLYNAVEALRSGRALTAKEEKAAAAGLARTLLDLHRRLDRAVLDAYGWTDLDAETPAFTAAVLTRLVALNAERRAEEVAGRVRFLRPAFQAPGASQAGLDLATPSRPSEAPVVADARPWPEALAARTVAVRQAVAAGAQTPDAVAARFVGARRADVSEVLDALAELGLVRAAGDRFVL